MTTPQAPSGPDQVPCTTLTLRPEGTYRRRFAHPPKFAQQSDLYVQVLGLEVGKLPVSSSVAGALHPHHIRRGSRAPETSEHPERRVPEPIYLRVGSQASLTIQPCKISTAYLDFQFDNLVFNESEGRACAHRRTTVVAWPPFDTRFASDPNVQGGNPTGLGCARSIGVRVEDPHPTNNVCLRCPLLLVIPDQYRWCTQNFLSGRHCSERPLPVVPEVPKSTYSP